MRVRGKQRGYDANFLAEWNVIVEKKRVKFMQDNLVLKPGNR